MNAKKIISTFIIAVIASFLVVLVTLKIIDYKPRVIEIKQKAPVYLTSNAQNVPENINFVNAANSSINSVVHIKTQYIQENTYNSLYDFFFGSGGQGGYSSPVISSGSGVIISSDGYIITNNHVIENSNNIEVILNDKSSYKAKIIGTDPNTDIALLKIDKTNLPVIKYGNSDDLKIGEWVLAVGNPFNLNSTVTAGIVSAKARNISTTSPYSIESFIQTDAAVNPGNSGGALINIKGELVGINTAIVSRTGSYVGYSFAIPINIVKKVVKDLLEFGKVQRAYLGVSIADLNADISKSLGISETKGVYINEVNKGGAAADAGILPGDIIIKIGNFNIDNIGQLHEQVSKYRPGDKVNITVLRNGKKKTFEIKFKNEKGNTSTYIKNNKYILGAKFNELSLREKQQLGISSGMQITELGPGKFRSVGVKKGFIVTKLNNKKINTISDVESALSMSKSGVLVEGIYPNGNSAFYAFGLK